MSLLTTPIFRAEAVPVRPQRKTIWVDLDNSPHVPFFAPIIERLTGRGHSVIVSARRCFQVCELADRMGLQYQVVGTHYGKHYLFKALGLCARAAQLGPLVFRTKPDLALSHGSRSQLILSNVFRIPSMVICDYEFARGFDLLRPTWMMYPEVIARNLPGSPNTLSYPGIKEDVYVPGFCPDDSIRGYLGLAGRELVITVRPPATEAHYHNAESEALLAAVFKMLEQRDGIKVILLPRNAKQEAEIRKAWPQLFLSGRMIVPKAAVDGLNLIWHSDLVISGGGTMNREAAALGIPVYSIFRGPIGAVDRYLHSIGKLILVESEAEVRTKIRLETRRGGDTAQSRTSEALEAIAGQVEQVLANLRAANDHR